MSVDSLADLQEFVDNCADLAWEAAEEAGLKKFAESAVQLRRKSFELSHSLVQHPQYADKPIYFAQKAWGVVVSVDLRGSTSWAMRVGARDTFVSMHVYMQTMLRLVSKANGMVIGLRGDGLLAVFGHRPERPDLTDDNTEASKDALRTAVKCGDAMTKAVDNVVNPALAERGITDALVAGVGVESGKMVITKIGIDTAYDVTAYGPPVDHAAKASSVKENRGLVLLGKTAKQAYPKSQGGKVKIRPFNIDFFRVTYPTPTLV